jgi:diguanylate cyclase
VVHSLESHGPAALEVVPATLTSQPPPEHRLAAAAPPTPAAQGSSLLPFVDFASAASETMLLLRRRLGFQLSLVTGVTGSDYVVLHTSSEGTADEGSYGPAVGSRFAWADTLCSRMAAGHPRVVPDLSQVPAYSTAPLAQQLPVGAFISVPLSNPDGRMLGTLCALDPRPQPAELVTELGLVELQARLLSSLFVTELHADQQRRRAERAELDALVDPLTQVANRRGWQAVLDREEQRCQRYGAAAGVIVIDLDGLKTINDRDGHATGDQLLREASRILQQTSRGADLVARTGGDEFAVLAVETSAAALQHDCNRLEHQLTVAGVAASVGAAARTHSGGLAAAWAQADAAMYAVKRLHHSGQPHPSRPPR